MTNLVLQPAVGSGSKEHYQDTILTGRNLNDDPAFIQHLTHAERAELSALAQSYGSTLRFWGIRPGERNGGKTKWEKISPGDHVVFYLDKNKTSNSAAIAKVISKIHNRALAEDIWGTQLTKNGHVQTFEYIYFVTEPENQYINIDELLTSIGQPNKKYIQEFNIKEPPKSTAGINFLGLPQNNPTSPTAPNTDMEPTTPIRRISSTSTDYQQQVGRLDALDSEVRLHRRTEQGILRRYLMQNETTDCGLCGRHFPISFLVAAHIKPRSKCTDSEKRDIGAIAMPACKMGCDELFGQGLISVNDNGKIVISSQAPSEGPVGAYINLFLRNKNAPRWEQVSGSKNYFSYHYENEFKS